ncbi:site-2 protease family protein [Haloarcula litorea]|uniref:site-2 protease family protein n=1 Tax=Haloarcula litorea TaxID=3032579 RepID=UPI0023E75E46|nr:site-2 protease family protein [Halomicroarcula sp. GDY20]
MVSTLTWVLAGLVAYTLAAMALKARGVVPDYIRFSGPITTIHTQRGKVLLDRLARPRRFWRAWGNLGVGVALVVMVGSFLLFVLGAQQAIVNPQPTALNEPRNALAIPGVNDFLPLSVAPEILLGLLLGLVVHEGGHGLFCRVEDVGIESMGVALLTVLPVGAFVEPDEDELLRSDRGTQIRMYAAGVTNNFALAIVALVLLFGPVAGSIAVVDGFPVGGTLPGTPAAEAGIGSGDVITAVDGRQVSDPAELREVLSSTDAQRVEVTRRDAEAVTVQREVVVSSAVASAPLTGGDTIVSVNGTNVSTSDAFVRAAARHPVAELATEDGRTVTMPTGGYVLVAEDGPLDDAGAPAGEGVVVTAVDGRRTVNGTALAAVLADTDPERTVPVVAYVDGQRQVYDVDVATNERTGGALLGVTLEPGVSGIEVNDFGIDAYPAATFLSVIGGDSGGAETPDLGFARRIYFTFLLPVIGAAPGTGFAYNFPGFTSFWTNFYTVEGPLGALGKTPVFLLANALFWTGWINIVVGQFNCVPTFPLDGGHILRATTESVVSRLPVPDRRQVTTAVTVAVTLSMVASLFLMVFGQRLLA